MPTVLLIGASRGIGLELASQYRRTGWRVIATARDDAGLARLRAQDCEALRVDVAVPDSNSGLAWQLDGEKLDLAVYVAGTMDRASTTTPPTRETFDRLMHTNVMGAAMALPQIVPMLQETQGVFAVISSVMGSLTQTQAGNAALYRVSKAALNMWLRCAQFDHPQLCCVALHPGWVQTEMGGSQAPLTPAQSATDIRQTLEQVRARRAAFQGAFLNHDGSPLPW
ncbi:MAG: SDR family oxidoreductase [Limnohabitans sp.]|nr:SDR family oxidoreductase [Limnohabitans sp.]